MTIAHILYGVAMIPLLAAAVIGAMGWNVPPEARAPRKVPTS